MREWVNKNILKIFLSFLFLQPVLDVITSVMMNVWNLDLTIGIVVRFLFLAFFFFYLVLRYRKKISKQSYVLFALLIVYLGIFTLTTLYLKGTGAIVYELKNALRGFYFPISLLIFYELSRQENIQVEKKHLFQILLLYMLLIFIPMITNTSFNGYTQGKIGTIGWFNSTNEISAIFSCILPIFLYQLWTTKHFRNIILFIILLLILFQLGSKIVIVSLCFSLLVNGFLFFQRQEKKKRLVAWGMPIIILGLVIVTLLLPKTSFYKNMKLHAEFLGMEKVTDIFKPEVIDRFIFSDRLTFLGNTNTSYEKSNPLEKVFGIGYIESYGTDQVSTKMIEMDPFDLFYRHGVVGFLVYMAPLVYVFYDLRKKYILEKEERTLLIVSIAMSFGMSLLTGHVLLAPAVSIYLVILLINLKRVG